MISKRTSIFLAPTLFVFCGLVFFVAVEKAAANITVKKWDVHEINLAAAGTYANPYWDVNVTAIFTGPGGISKTVKGFWDGGNSFKVRFTPTATGTWTYSISNDKNDSGLSRSNQVLNIVDPDPGSRGFMRVENQYNDYSTKKFAFDDGSHYLMLGTTAYEYIANARDAFGRNNNRWHDTVDFYLSKGINKVRFYVFPTDYKLYDSSSVRDNSIMTYPDSRPFVGENTGPATLDHRRLNIPHWQALDRMVQYMSEKGMVADLIMLNDPRYIRSYSTQNPNSPAAEDLRYMSYIVARYAAYPNVIWCITNEYMLTQWGVSWDYGLIGTTAYWKPFWNALGSLVRSEDPWISDAGKLRPLSIHGWNRADYPDPSGRYSYNIPYFDFYFKNEAWPTFAISEWDFGHINDYGAPDWSAQRGVLKSVQHNNTLTVNDEAAYVGGKYSWNQGFSGASAEVNRKFTWGTYMAGAYFAIGDAYSLDGRSPIDGNLNPGDWGSPNWSAGNYWYGSGSHMKTAYDELKILYDFFTTKGIEYWKMGSRNDLVPQYSQNKRIYTLAELGQQYIVYSAAGNPFTISLVPGRQYVVYRFNPRTGAEEQVGTVAASASSYSGTPPAGGEDWVYRIKAVSNNSQQCSNGRDDDGDSKTDFGQSPNNDPGCTHPEDNSETGDPLPENGLVARWTMDNEHVNGGVFFDSSTFNNHGIGTGTSETAGKNGQGRLFNGASDVVNVYHANSFASGSGTFAAWFKIDDLAKKSQAIVGKDASGCAGDCGHFYIVYNDEYYSSRPPYAQNKLMVRLQNNSNASYFLVSDDAKGKIQAGTWHHVAAVFGAGGMKLHIDGVLHAADAHNKGLAGNSEMLTIGNYYEPNYGLKGSLDDLRVYNRQLSTEEILALANPSQYAAEDVNRDGSVNIKDIQAVIKEITNSTWTCHSAPCNADVNGDGSVNIKDIQAIIKEIIK